MKFQHIGLVAKLKTKGIQETLPLVFNYLNSKKIPFSCTHETAELLSQSSTILGLKDLAKQSDLIIVVGGDGSLLSVARTAVLYDTPILGISCGKLGFLTDIRPDDIQKKLDKIFSGKYLEEKRFLLSADVTKHDQSTHTELALNEVVLGLKEMAQMLEFEVYSDSALMYGQRSDGLIIATPTGSTAYALSAGGPIIQPNLNVIVLIPKFPHSLTYRPIVIDGDSTIQIKLAKTPKQLPLLVLDGHNEINLTVQDKIIIHKFEKTLRLIHPQKYCYSENLRSKLHWGTQLTDSFK